MNKTKTGVILGILFVLVLVCAVSAPYIIVEQMKSAVQQQDAEGFSRYIDFPVLRYNIKIQVNKMLEDKLSEAAETNPFASFGMSLGNMIADKMVNVLVTPTAITGLMKGLGPGASDNGDGSTDGSMEILANAEMSYLSFDEFLVVVPLQKPEEESDEEILFIFTRSGIIWKLTDIKLPWL